MKNTLLKKYILFILIILVIGLGVAAVYFYKQSKLLDTSVQESMAEAQSLSKKVGRIVLLPEGETPTIATVSDPEALRDQAFFADSKVGYKVLIYSNAKKAILFDPVANKIINIAPLNTKNNAESVPLDEQ